MFATDTETSFSYPVRSRIFQFVWLDELPLEVCARITSFLSPCRNNHNVSVGYIPDPLSLAAVSPIQKFAVASAHSDTLRIEQAESVVQTVIQIRLWRDVLDGILEVALPHDVPNSIDVRNLLSLQSIQKAYVTNYSYITHSLKAGGSVRFLELNLTTYCPEYGNKVLSTRISDLLHSCPIEELHLVCQGCGQCPKQTCIAVRFLVPIEMEGREYSTFRSLRVKCASRRMEKLPIVASSFPYLEELRLEHSKSMDHELGPPVELKMMASVSKALLKMTKVELLHLGRIESFVPLLGIRLTALGSSVPINGAIARMLSSCKYLRALDLILEAGVEMFIPQDLVNLTSLSLTWDRSSCLSCERLYAPITASLSQLVQRNREIRELRLRNVTIASSLLTEVLRTLGDKLHVLEVPVFFQNEPPGHRFSRLASLILRNCVEVQDLEICSASLKKAANFSIFTFHELGICEAEKCELCELRKSIDRCLRVLTKRLTGFRDDGVQKLRCSLEPEAHGE